MPYLLPIRVVPKSSKNSIEGVMDDNGKKALKIKITAPPEDSKANKAVVKFLAKSFGLRMGDICIRSGDKSRSKLLNINGESEELSRWLDALE